jgi:hypothetical protein
VKKLPLILLLALGLLFSGCAMSVPIDPSLLMLLLKNDPPPPTLNITPKAGDPAPTNTAPGKVTQDNTAVMG